MKEKDEKTYQQAVECLKEYSKQNDGITVFPGSLVMRILTKELSCDESEVLKILKEKSSNKPFTTVLERAGFSYC